MHMLRLKNAIDLHPGDQVITLDPLDEEGDVLTVHTTEVRQEPGQAKVLLVILEAGIFDLQAVFSEAEFETPILVLGKPLTPDA